MHIAIRASMAASLLMTFCVLGQPAHAQSVGFDDMYNNTGVGASSLTTVFNNENGIAMGNTGIGSQALAADLAGSYNTALGASALANDTGNFDTAVGEYSLYYNTSGTENVGLGSYTLYQNATGSFNTAIGQSALFQLKSGSYNTAVGVSALFSSVSSSNNIAVGYEAGQNETGSDDVDIGNLGVAGEFGVMRIGTPGTQTTASISGISTSQVTGAEVYVTSDGQLGVLASSERFKTEITSMPNEWARLAQLRPVTFHLKTEPRGALQYGLIAEEVDTIIPELVIRDAAGEIQGVRYDELAPMLLTELQNRRQRLTVMSASNHAQAEHIRQLKQQVSEMQALRITLRTAFAAHGVEVEQVARR